MFDLYHQNDFSLGEIAEECEVSRQAVFDIIKRTEHTLEEYEQKLGLAEKNRERRVAVERLSQLLDKWPNQEQLGEVRQLIEQLG